MENFSADSNPVENGIVCAGYKPEALTLLEIVGRLKRRYEGNIRINFR
jgi:hypothetical protein